MLGKLSVVLFACETLFLGGGNDFAISHQAGSAIVVKGRNAQDIHLGIGG